MRCFHCLNPQSAALTACQHLMSELRQQPSDVSADESTDEDEDNEAVLQKSALSSTGIGSMIAGYNPPPQSSIVARLQKARKVKPAQPLPSPIVVQLMEMGFPRKKVEEAIKYQGMAVHHINWCSHYYESLINELISSNTIFKV